MSDEQETQELAEQFQRAVGPLLTHVVIQASSSSEDVSVSFLLIPLERTFWESLLPLIDRVKELYQTDPAFSNLDWVRICLPQNAPLAWYEFEAELSDKFDEQPDDWVFVNETQVAEFSTPDTGEVCKLWIDHVNIFFSTWMETRSSSVTVESSTFTREDIEDILKECP